MTLTKRITAFFLASLLCLSLFSCGKEDEPTDSTTDPDEFTGSISQGGDQSNDKDNEQTVDEGDEAKTYEIKTADDLKNMKRKGTYVLMNDIDLTGVEWTPVGTYAAPFVGTFDGNGYSLKNLNIFYDKQDAGETIGFFYTYCGLFGVTDGAKIKNVKFENVKIESASTVEFRVMYAGAVAGLALNSEITNCSVTGEITSKSLRFISASGAIAGQTKRTSITDCSTNATVTVQESSNRAEAGGLVGNTAVGTVITNCYSEGPVLAYSDIGIAYSGGLIGYASATTVTKCYSKSNVTAEITSSAPTEGKVGAAYAGGLVGLTTAASADTSSKFSYSYSLDGKITATGNENIAYAGGLAAKSAFASFKNCYTYSSVTAQTNLEIIYLGGAFGEVAATSTIAGCFAKNDVAALAADNTNVKIGAFAGFPDAKDGSTADNITSSIYYTGSAFTINGKETSNLAKNASGRQLLIFNNFDSLIFDLKWDKSEWTLENGIPRPL